MNGLINFLYIKPNLRLSIVLGYLYKFLVNIEEKYFRKSNYVTDLIK